MQQQRKARQPYRLQTGLILLALFLLLCSCKNSALKPVAQCIIGRWQITDWQIPNMPPEDTIMQRMIREAGAGPDKFGYMDFTPDGHLKMSIMGQSETITYRISGDTLTINNRAAEPSRPMLVILDAANNATIRTLNNDKVYVLRRTAK